MIAESPVRFGLIGAGGIAQTYVRSFPDCRAAKLVAVADVRPEAAEAAAGVAGCEAFTSWEEMCDACELDAVIVSTPPSTHPEIVEALVARGLHVLCEKPLAIDSASAEAMYDAAERHGVLLTMATKFRFVDDVVKARSLVTSGILGDVILFENAFTAHVDMSNRWNSDPAISGGGVLVDNGTHSVDLVRFFLGPIAELQAVEGRRVQSVNVEDTARLFLKTDEGVMAGVDLSWSINKQLPWYVSIFGSQGTIVVGWKESKYRRSQDDEWIVFGNGYDKFQAFRSQLDNFARAIRGRDKLLVTREDALASVKVIEAAYANLGNAHWTPIDDVALASNRDTVDLELVK